MVLLVGLGDQRRDRFEGGEDGDLLPVGVHHQYFVEEAEALQRRLEPRRAARGAERRGVDALHVLSECVVDGPYRIDRTRHDRPPLSTCTFSARRTGDQVACLRPRRVGEPGHAQGAHDSRRCRVKGVQEHHRRTCSEYPAS